MAYHCSTRGSESGFQQWPRGMGFLFLKVCQDTGLPKAEVINQAKTIVDEMAHNLRTGAIRVFAFFLMKVLKQLYQRIYVNEEGIEKVSHQLTFLLWPSALICDYTVCDFEN